MFKKPIKKLNLPKLTFQRDVEVSHPERPFTGKLFKLDWSKCDNEKYQHVKNHLHSWVNDKEEEKNQLKKFPGIVPKELKNFLDNSKFLISSEYLTQIRANTLQAYNSLLSIHITGDTMIREYCLKPVNINIQVAFFLIADCLFDEGTNYFDRNYSIHLITSMLLWRYWSFHTGRGLLREKCLIDELEESLNYLDKDPKRKKQYEKHIDLFDSWFEKVEKFHSYISSVDEDVEGEDKQ